MSDFYRKGDIGVNKRAILWLSVISLCLSRSNVYKQRDGQGSDVKNLKMGNINKT